MTREEWDAMTSDEQWRQYTLVHGYEIVSHDWTPNSAYMRISLPCSYCLTDWDCAVRLECSHSTARYELFKNAGSDPRVHLKGDKS